MRGLAVAALVLVGCSTSTGRPGIMCMDGYEGCPCVDGTRCLTGLSCLGGTCIDPTRPPDGGTGGDAAPWVPPNPEAYWAADPPIQYCYMDGTMSPLPPVPMTLDELHAAECPPDKNREGCRCLNVGERAPCWPGLTRNRDRGICHDGETICQPYDEFTGRWGACVGAQLPIAGVTRGAGACHCFSRGRWDIDNMSPCFIDYYRRESEEAEPVLYARGAVSTYVDANGASQCPSDSNGPPPDPAGDWSANRLTVDCEGRFRLCYRLFAGSMPATLEDPRSSSDCMLAESCTEGWYSQRDQVQEFPALPPWTSTNRECIERWQSVGGYGEMTVRGLSVECVPIDDGSDGEYLFNRVKYCPSICNSEPSRPECQSCMQGGSGEF
jgi:hypothetical protein